MNESDLLIKIRTALEAGGIDAAKAKIAELTAETEKNKTANVGNAAENQKTIQTLRNLQSAANGNITAIAKLTGETGQLGAALMKAGALAAAFGVGWQAGLKIGDWVWSKYFNLNDFDKTTGSIRDQMKATIASIKELNDQKMTELLDEFKKLDAAAAKLDKTTTLEQRREQQLLDAQQRTEAAKLDESFAGRERGPEYERQRAELEKRHAEEQQNLKFEQLGKQEQNLRQNLEGLTAQLQSARKAKDEAEREEKLAVDRAVETKTSDDAKAGLAAKARADEARARYAEVEKQYRERQDQVASKQYEIETERMVSRVGGSETRSRYRGALTSASAEEQRIRADQEATALAQRQRAEQDALVAQRDKQAELVRRAEEEARTAAEAARDFAPRGAGKGFAAAKARDMALDEAARDKEEAVAGLKQILADINAQIKALKATQDAEARDRRSANKAMPV